MWNSFSTDARVRMTAEVITYPGGNGDEIHAWLARPDGDGGAGIVAVHHLSGWDEFYREFAERLARHGYIVICPDPYCRFGQGTPDDVAGSVRSQGGVRDDDSVVADCAAALSWLKALPAGNGKAGVIGTCSGGRHALPAASLVPGFDAVATCGEGAWSWRRRNCPGPPGRPDRLTPPSSPRPCSRSSATRTHIPRPSR